MVKSCRYLLAWRARNRREELRGRGYGLIAGQSADMREGFHSFKLNVTALHGLEAAAGVLRLVRPDEAEALLDEAAAWRFDLRAAVLDGLARAPVVPLSDGTWTASLPPWPELDRPAFWDNTRPALTHGTFLTRDNTVASNLIFHGLFAPDDPIAERLLRYETDLYHVRNVRHSQPYVSKHPWVHLQRGETHAFLKAYYNGLMSLADRETYSFWEHYYGICLHKTEGESGFLMQTRWMLWLEKGNRLALLPGIPRAWMQDGNTLCLRQVATHFGPLSLSVRSRTAAGSICAEYCLEAGRRPEALMVRLPHPRRLAPWGVEGGEYDVGSESVIVRNPPASGGIVLQFSRACVMQHRASRWNSVRMLWMS